MPKNFDYSMVTRIDRSLTGLAHRGLQPVAIYIGNCEFEALRSDDQSWRRMAFCDGVLKFDGIPVHHVNEIEHFHVSTEYRKFARMTLPEESLADASTEQLTEELAKRVRSAALTKPDSVPR